MDVLSNCGAKGEGGSAEENRQKQQQRVPSPHTSRYADAFQRRSSTSSPLSSVSRFQSRQV